MLVYQQFGSKSVKDTDHFVVGTKYIVHIFSVTYTEIVILKVKNKFVFVLFNKAGEILFDVDRTNKRNALLLKLFMPL
jgi:hypothetical protein